MMDSPQGRRVRRDKFLLLLGVLRASAVNNPNNSQTSSLDGIVARFVNFAINYVTTYRPLQVAMAFDAQAILANLNEKERIHGHHSPEGQAIRTLGRALHGWSTGNLSGADVVVLCDQAIADWLKRKLKVSAWSAIGMTELLAAAAANDVLSPGDTLRLQRMHAVRADTNIRVIAGADVEAALACAIEIVEQHWS